MSIEVPQNVGPVEFNTAAIEIAVALDNMRSAVLNVSPAYQLADNLQGVDAAALWVEGVVNRLAHYWPVPEIEVPFVDDSFADPPVVPVEEAEIDHDAAARGAIYPNIGEGPNADQ